MNVLEILYEGQNVEELKNLYSTKVFRRVVPSFLKWLNPFEDNAVWLAALKSGYNVWMRMLRQQFIDPALLLKTFETSQ